MSNIARIGVPVNVTGPFKPRRIRMAGANISSLQLLELLLSTEFVGLGLSISGLDIK